MCGHPLPEKRMERFYSGRVNFCPECKRKYRTLRGTPLRGTHFTYADIVMFALLTSFGCHVNDIGRIVNHLGPAVKGLQRRLHALSEKPPRNKGVTQNNF
jgi:hypothetical protein